MAIEWRPVVGYEGFYEVSSSGQVRSLTRHTGSKAGSTQVHKGRILKLTVIKPYGYFRVCLSVNNVHVTKLVHKLVADAFLGPCPPDQEIRHGPGGRQDNRVGNLCYGTHVENLADRHRDGTAPIGSNGNGAKLTEEHVIQLRRERAAGESGKSLAIKYGIGVEQVYRIATGKNWKHVPHAA